MKQQTLGKSRYMAVLWVLLVASGLLAWFGGTPVSQAASYHNVYKIPVEQSIERGLESFLIRAFAEAEAKDADLVILDIDTPGGEVEAATNIGTLIRQAPMKTIAYIDNHAFSAGTYIALNANQIVMTPGSSIGAAAPIDRIGNTADIKLVSGWSNQMVAAANLNGRNADIARAMVEVETAFPGIKEKGTVLSLEAEKALKVGYADKLVANQAELYQSLGIKPADVHEIQPTVGEKVARFVTDPFVMSALLVIGLVGIVVELFVPGFGVGGTIGIGAFALYFFGHYVAGFANALHIALFIFGALLMVLEIFLPGGIVGGIGFISMVSGLVMAAYDTKQGLLSLGIAAAITAIVIFILIKYVGVKRLWGKFVLSDEQQKAEGYVAPKDQSDLLGQTGIVLTSMRPAGVVKIQGKRVDAVSAGNFIQAGATVVVVQIEGTRVVVQEQELIEKE